MARDYHSPPTTDAPKPKTIRRVRFGSIKIGQKFKWGTIDPLYIKTDEGCASRFYDKYIGKMYAFADKCLVTRVKEQSNEKNRKHQDKEVG